MKQKYIGLNDEEIIKSKNKNGINEIETKKKETIINKIIDLFKEPMFLLLLIASAIYFILGEITDGITMLVFVCFVSSIDIIQEWKTDKAIEALNNLSALNVKVIRNNKTITINSKDIVVDDIVILEEGDKVPADGVILESSGLGINESVLTGESATIYKTLTDNSDEHFKRNICYMGTNVSSGSAIIKIINVGINTEYGKIGQNLNTITKQKTPLEKQTNKLIYICTIFSLILFITVVILNLINNTSSDTILSERIIHAILSGITVAMATIPEEIPVVLTVFLAMGASSLAKKNTLTRNMKVVETLGAVSVLCVDKTGTLTQNKMTVEEAIDYSGNLNMVASLACPKNPYDPMEQAILEYCYKNNINKNIFENKLVYEYIFNNEDKMFGQIWNVDNQDSLYVKGAYETVLPICNLNEKEDIDIKNKIKDLSNKGYRVIACASLNNIETREKKLTDYKLNFDGVIALIDPPKVGVRESLKQCYEAGIRVIMITGDNGKTASSIADQIGLIHEKNYITGLQLENMSDGELKEAVMKTNIFTRVYPNHKMRIVSALQANNEVVAMTGDGVNDSPALKKAEIGIAMGKRGTNVAKEASDMILMDDDFTTIVDSIKNGRTIYNNIKKAISYVIAIHIPIALAAIVIPILKLPLLLLPVHIVLLELIIDPTSSIIFQRIKPDNNVMQNKPRKINESLVNKKTLIKNISQGLLIALMFLGSYLILIKTTNDSTYAFTFAFTLLIISNTLIVYVLESDDLAIKNLFRNLKDKIVVLINLCIVIGLILIIYLPLFNKIVGTKPLNLQELVLIILLSILATFSFDILKIIKK